MNKTRVENTPRPDIRDSSVVLLSVVAGVIERRGRWLLAQRPEYKAHGGLWEFPGGKVDSNESLAQALQRELNEELALSPVEVGRVLDVQTSPALQLHFLAVTTESAPIALEHSAIGWFGPAEAAALDLAPLDRAFIKHFGPLRST